MNRSPEYYDDKHENPLEIPEYNFEEGLRTCLEIITEKLTQQKVVAIAVNGAEPNVGKTTISSEIAQHFKSSNHIVASIADLGQLDNAFQILEIELEYDPNRNILLVLNAEDVYSIPAKYHQRVKESKNKELKQETSARGLSFEQIDLWIAIQSPTKKFHQKVRDEIATPFGDLIITNQHAKDKR